MIKWFTRNHVAANLLMISIIIIGIMSIKNDIPLETVPEITLDSISIVTVLPGGNPKSIEQTITSRIEEAIADIEGVEDITSRSSEGFSGVSVVVKNGYDPKIVLSDLKVRVDALTTLPSESEKPIIQLTELAIPVIGIGIHSSAISYDELYDISSMLRKELLTYPGITKVSELFAPDREINIEVSPLTLQQYKLTIEQIGTAIQNNSIDLSAGNLKTRDGNILIRTNGQAYSEDEFNNIPVFNVGDHVIYLKDIATVSDSYEQLDIDIKLNKEDAILFEVSRTGNQNTIDVAEAVLQFIDEHRSNIRTDVHISTYMNNASIVKDRLTMLISSALMGGLLVMIILSLFLRPSVAFWVSMGIPISFLGAFALMPVMGISLNMISMFAFILVLGIVVDDAIVTGENIYRHTRNGMDPSEAAVFGTQEVAVPVTFGVITTMVAFSPMLFVDGMIGSVVKQVPMIVIPVLAFSLIESKFILPAHMSSIKIRNKEKLSTISKIQQNFSLGFESAVIKIYQPFLNSCIRNKSITLVSATSVLVLTFALLTNGWLKTAFLPQFPNDSIFISLTMPSTTGYETVEKNINHIANIANQFKAKLADPVTGESYVATVVSAAGIGMQTLASNKGIVILDMASADKRPTNFSVEALSDELRKAVGDIPGAEKIEFSSSMSDFGRPISIAIYGDDTESTDKVITQVRSQLKTYPGVFDIQDDFSSGKDEIQIALTPLARSLGISLASLSNQLRQAVYGLEVQRIQRGHDEMKVMVRYPLENRSKIIDVQHLPIQVPNTLQSVPLSDLATLTSGESPTTVYRDNRKRIITVSADIDSLTGNAKIIRADLQQYVDKLLLTYPNITYSMEGQAKAERDALSSLALGLALVMLAIYSLLAIPFKSFIQPLIVMSIIPLSFVGALLGHVIMGYAISALSLMGILALTGIVVNDSLVLVDYINKERSRDKDVMHAILSAGAVRFRPIILTSFTTFAGLIPLMFSKSLQAQELIPMAISLGFGIIFATMITLIIVPVNYLIYYNLVQKFKNLEKTSGQPNNDKPLLNL